jgi:hypothetical protein
MLSEQTKNYIASWRKKINNYTREDLVDVFDLFSGYYKQYMRLAQEVAEELFIEGKINRLGEDKKTATNYILLYIAPEKLYQLIIDDGNEANIEYLGFLMSTHAFNIKFDSANTHHPEKDAELAISILSEDKNKKMLAILEIIYYVRCNIEHARKHFEEEQRFLLEPLASILKSMVESLTAQLSV